MGKKKRDNLVSIKLHQPFTPPHEGIYYQVLVWRKPEFGFYSSLGYVTSPRWEVYAEGEDMILLAPKYDEAKELYAKVQIRKTERTVILGGSK